MSNSQIKKALAISHNEAYLESKKPRVKNVGSVGHTSRAAKQKALTLMAIAPVLAASVNPNQ